MNRYEHSTVPSCETGPTIITLKVRLAETESKFIQSAIQAAIEAYRYPDGRNMKEPDFMDEPKQ